MDKPSKLNERLTLIANLSVVVGIIFLAVELRQNTQAIQAQTRDSITEKQMMYLGWIATSPELAEATETIEQNGDPFVEGAGARQFRGYAAAIMREGENSLYQYENGLFTEEELVARRDRWRNLMSQSAYLDFWRLIEDSFAPNFRAEIDRIVAEVGG